MGQTLSPEESSLFAVNTDGVCPFQPALMKDSRGGSGQKAAVAVVEQAKQQKQKQKVCRTRSLPEGSLSWS